VQRMGPLAILVFSAWCGLISGLLEVAAIVVRKQTFDQDQFYAMSRHFIWLVPLINLVIFLAVGVFVLLPLGRSRAYWLTARVLAALTFVPPFWAAFPRIYGAAGVLLVLGFTSRLAPAFERRADAVRRLVRVSFGGVAGVVLILAASVWGADLIRQGREGARPLPPPGSPNVLFIVLDTVAAEHLSLYGYRRPTSPTITDLASRGIRFDRAQATSSWTLPSHASMFTGRWPHELSVGWLTPLDGACPTLAEFLGERGYATAGFVANYRYCAVDSGLSRGFTYYRDYFFPRLSALKTAVTIAGALEGLSAVDDFLEDWLDIDVLKPAVDLLSWLITNDPKPAEVVNGEFLEWLSWRRQHERPFFAFLNFFDAHHPYRLPPETFRRFGTVAEENRGGDPVEKEMLRTHRPPSEQNVSLLRDAYDDCIANLDEQLGVLIDELERRALLERTWVIIASDHGESFGEHPFIFRHGISLYQTELHVPLVVVPPRGDVEVRIVTKTVSVRDMAATVVDILHFNAGSPFPGDSLALFWNGKSPAPAAGVVAPDHALSEVVPIDPFRANPWRTDQLRGPLAALTEGDWSYIRRDLDAREMLFNLGDDAGQSHDLAGDAALQPILAHLRAVLKQITGGPLTPQRFNP
jgi:arylsulfatase A-like enzyme